MAREESLMLVALITASVTVMASYGSDVNEARLWAGVLAVQAVPYFAALVTATASAIPGWDFLPGSPKESDLLPSGQNA